MYERANENLTAQTVYLQDNLSDVTKKVNELSPPGSAGPSTIAQSRAKRQITRP